MMLAADVVAAAVTAVAVAVGPRRGEEPRPSQRTESGC